MSHSAETRFVHAQSRLQEYYYCSHRKDLDYNASGKAKGRFAPRPDSEETPTEDIVEADARTKQPQKIQIQQQTFIGMAWCAAWLFTIGYLHLSFWRGVLAIIL
jgi:hypothetical protein